MVANSKQEVLTALTNPVPNNFYSYSNISTIPRIQGVYVWYFNGLPAKFPANECVVRHAKALLYVGESVNLYDRMQAHSNSVTLSTMRQNLAKLLCTYKGVASMPIAMLDNWMNEHAFAVWTEYYGDREEAEQYVMDNIWVILNIRGNKRFNVSNL